jgi:hypothetical protein
MQIAIHQFMGTANRNHCNVCLWSRHVDINKGDRKADCKSGMKPIALTFKNEGIKQGEIMLVHKCTGCSKISINRIAADDIEAVVLDVYNKSLKIEPDMRGQLLTQKIKIAQKSDEKEVKGQLYGYI